MSENCYKVLGLMSGTSLDGLDVAYCIFEKTGTEWSYRIVEAFTYVYPKVWQERLAQLHELNAEEMTALDISYGKWTGKMVNEFLNSYKLEKPDFIGSHGHTVFHNPKAGYTLQIGNGAAIAAITACKTISDFRTQNVVLGGQGAPLVPIGDKALFGDKDACLNLGGFANISYQDQGSRIAFDICPANIVLNPLAKTLGMDYDKNGDLARDGKVIVELLEELNGLSFYQEMAPKSLGIEWVKENVNTILNQCQASKNDILCTLCEHIALQIATCLHGFNNVMVSGGGVWNAFLMERIKANTILEIHVPEHKLVDYKESLIFAFLAVLRDRNEVNCLASVTGAKKDHSSGIIHY